jgi:hypothetical protein
MQIESNIPFEDHSKNRKYPWGDMQVGDSVLITDNTHSARCSAYSYGKRNGKEFRSRSEGDGLRIFRTE